MRRHSSLTLLISSVLLCAAGVVLSVVGYVCDGRLPHPEAANIKVVAKAVPTPSASAGLAQLLATAGPDSVLTSDMTIFWVTHYNKSNDNIVRQTQPDGEAVGKTVKEFATGYPDYTLDLTTGQIRMVRIYDQYSPDFYFIQSDVNGNIYVYRNLEGKDKLTMVMKMNFNESAVPKDYRPLIRQGMAFGSVEEIEGLIEDAET